MSKDQSDNAESKNIILEKIKDYAGVASGAATFVAGTAVGDPILAMGGAVTFFSSFITPFMMKNRDEFLKQLLIEMKRLEAKFDRKLDDMLNENVLKAILKLYPVIVRENKKEKRKLLRNSILNIALAKNPEDDLTSIFLGWIDGLEPTHVRILKFLENPNEYMKQNHIDPKSILGGDRYRTITRVFPELENTWPPYFNDLNVRQLLMTDEILHTNITPTSRNITPTGSQFLKFIESPFKDEPPE